MASDVDTTIPADNTKPVKSEFRAQFSTIKDELEALQLLTSLAWKIALGDQSV